MTADDLPALLMLYHELTGRDTAPDALRRSFRLVNENPHYLLIGAKTESGTLIGSALGIICLDVIDSCRPWMVVENVIVSNQARGQGIGKLLMAHLEDHARAHGCSYISLTSDMRREPAHRFYESIGYAGDRVKAFRKNL